MKRRLAAILAADVVGYGVMIQQNELGTIQNVKGHIEAFGSHLTLHHGRIVKTMGDGFLAEFASVVDAVACAETFQRVSAERNQSLPDNEQVVFRMGVHAGDVFEDDGDLLGDGVNVAARLESIGTPGSVTISARVHEEIEGRIDLTFSSLGLQSLKQGEKSIGVFELQHRSIKRAVKLELPDKPSIAVLPFVVLSDDLKDGFLADGLCDDLTTALSGIPWIFVIARNSAYAYKGLSVDARRIGQELGVQYIVEGAVRRMGQKLRMSAQLVDTANGRQIWADKYDGTQDNVFEFQDQIASKIVNIIAPQIQNAEIRRSIRKRPSDISSYDMYLGALDCLNNARLAEAIDLLNKAIAIFPDYASAKAILAWSMTLKVAWQSTPDYNVVRDEGLRLCHEALDSTQHDVESDAYAAYSLAFLGDDISRSMKILAGVVEQSPSFAWAWVSRSMLEAFYGNAERGREYGELALRINPRDPLMFRTFLALTNCDVALKDYMRALERANEGLNYNSGIIGLQMFKVFSLVKLDRLSEAREEVKHLLARHPSTRASSFSFIGQQFPNIPDVSEDLKMAGLPE